jgi:hypothetical protein
MEGYCRDTGYAEASDDTAIIRLMRRIGADATESIFDAPEDYRNI